MMASIIANKSIFAKFSETEIQAAMTPSDNCEERREGHAHNTVLASPMRSRQMQNPIDRVIVHPLAALLVQYLSRWPVTPNMVSITGALAIILAGMAYTQLDWPMAVLTGFGMHMVWHVLDGADGDLARMTGRASPAGEIVDGLSDYLGNGVLYFLLGAMVAQSAGSIAWVLALGAALSRAVQASFYESQRRRFLSWAYDVDWIGANNGDGRAVSHGWIGRAYLRAVIWMVPDAASVDKAMREPARAQRIKDRLRQTGPRPLAGSMLLGAPYRTLVLALAMAAQYPLAFFLYEAIALNAVLLAAILSSRRRMRELAALD